MTDHELKSWLDDLNESILPLCQLINAANEAEADGDPASNPLDDTFGWGVRFHKMMKTKALQATAPCGLLLTGPNGCGKHTAAVHMFRTLYDTHCGLLLDGRELCADGYAAATQRLRYVLDHPNVDEQRNAYPWCLILEGMEDCSCRQELLSWLGQVVEATWLESAGAPSLFVILIDSCEDDIPSILRRHLRLCRMSLPTASRRRAYFMQDKYPTIQIAVNLKLLVDSTEGLTYTQLVDLARNLECALYCLSNGQTSMTDQELREFLQEQLPDPSLEDPLQSLAQSARLFIEHLPELMTHMGTAVVPAAAVQTAETQTDSPQHAAPQANLSMPSESDFKKEITDMRVKDLSTDLLGEERMTELLAMHSNRQTA